MELVHICEQRMHFSILDECNLRISIYTDTHAPVFNLHVIYFFVKHENQSEYLHSMMKMGGGGVAEDDCNCYQSLWC